MGLGGEALKSAGLESAGLEPLDAMGLGMRLNRSAACLTD